MLMAGAILRDPLLGTAGIVDAKLASHSEQILHRTRR
jgi:hypothetical protein